MSTKSVNKYPLEPGVPEVLSPKDKGLKVLFRIPGQVVIVEGQVDDFTPSKTYVKISGRWVRNRMPILAVMKEKVVKKRKNPYVS